MTISIKSVVALTLTCIAVDAFAKFVSESDVHKAAEAFVSADAIGSSVLSGRSVAAVSKRDGLWIVSLAPSGHVIFSGSDLVDPIVGFSKDDFVEPDPDSPAFSVLEAAGASVAKAEAQGGETCHARWTKLLADGVAKSGLLKADNPPSGAVVVEPFLVEHYNQWQPYNDYAPVFEPDESNFASDYKPYRGRCPCGCVATASAQFFHNFKWPARIDKTISYNHQFAGASNVNNAFHVRFDGHEPICWNALSNSYAYSYVKGYKTYYDLRGGVAESVRYPIARLILWCDVMAHMDFASDGSSANYGTVAGSAAEWYTQGTWVSATDARVQSDIANGVPVQVTVPGHAVVGHGWANDGGNKYIYLNYGWGGSNDGYYNINGSTIQEVYVGHYPRAKPQIDPLPVVSGSNLTLAWSFPDFYTNSLSGFTVSLKKTATETSTYTEGFSDSSGVVSGDDGIFKVGTHSKGYDGKLLYCFSSYLVGGYATVNSAYYTFPEVYTLTSASMLTLKLRSYLALSNDFEIQARFNGGEWTTIMSPSLTEEGDSGWGTESLYLGNHGGETIQLRFYKAYTGGSCYTERDCIFVDDVVLTDVLMPGQAVTRNVSASARSCEFTGLDAGSACAFTVTPVMSEALVAAEASEPMTTSIAGERYTPIPGEQTYSTGTLSFSSSDTSGVWSYSYGQYGSLPDDTTVRDPFGCSISAALPGEITSSSSFTFSWKTASGSYSSGNDTLSVVFTDSSGEQTTLWTKSVSKNTSKQDVDLPLSSLAGKTGRIVLSYSHPGSAYTGSSYGGFLYAPKVTNVLVPTIPAVAWNTETLVQLAAPEILSVTAVTEGFYGECGTNSSTFTVTCSSTVDSLEARPSHLSLVRDEDVTVTKTGSGTFSVSIAPSGINESNFRSRMILTLIASDANGTKCYKDLSLRFSEAAQAVSDVVVSASTSDGAQYSVVIPYSWIEANGLASEGSDAAAHEAAVSANADADSDGLPNWAEYVCGTSPTDPAEKLVAFITMEDGKPVVTYSPGDSQIAAGFKAVIKGTTDLTAALSTWEVVTETRTSACRFFRVEIVPED